MQIDITLIFIELMSDILFILMCDTENLNFSNIFYSSGFNVESREGEKLWFFGVFGELLRGVRTMEIYLMSQMMGSFFSVGSSAAVTDAPLLFSDMLLLSITYFFCKPNTKKTAKNLARVVTQKLFHLLPVRCSSWQLRIKQFHTHSSRTSDVNEKCRISVWKFHSGS